MRYVLGVDGGQTATLAAVANEDGELLGAGRGGPANHINEPGGPERCRRSVTDAVGGALASAGLSGQPMAAAYFGMTGGGPLIPQFLPEVVAVESLKVEGDARAALTGATVGQPGVLVIAGTGSIAFAVNARGEEAVTGGWGYIMGDEGSGYDVAIQALHAATKAADGRGPATLLETAIPAHFGLENLRALHRKIYSGELDRPRLAEISRVVGDAANAGDEPARAILARAAGELAIAAVRVLELVGALDEALPVAPVGGVFKAGAPILDPFRAALARLAPRVWIQTPEFPPVIGAVILALRQIGRPIDEALVARLRAGMGIVGGIK